MKVFYPVCLEKSSSKTPKICHNPDPKPYNTTKRADFSIRKKKSIDEHDGQVGKLVPQEALASTGEAEQGPCRIGVLANGSRGGALG